MVRSQCSCKPPPNKYLSSVLTRKGKVPRLNFRPPRPKPWLRGGVPARAGYTAREHPSSTDLSWRRPQGQVPRPCPAIITEGTRHPGPHRPSRFSCKRESVICIGSIGIHAVANTSHVNSQLTTIALL